MTMVKSRRAAAKASPEPALPVLTGRWSEAEIQALSDEMLSDLDAAARGASTALGAKGLQIVALSARLTAHEQRSEEWLRMAFERIEKLERELKATKGLQSKSLDRRFSLEDLEVEQIDDRNIKIALVRGDDEAAFTLKFPVVVDRGPWNERATYERGDGVSHGGSWWIASQDFPGKPGDGTWRLAVKRGRDGKEARA